MKTKVLFNCVGLSLKEEKGKDGQSFYKMSVDQDGEAGTFSMTEDAYKSIVGTFARYKPCSVTAEFNDQYKSMRIIGVSQGVR